MEKIHTQATTGITTALILACSIIFAATAGSIILGDSDMEIEENYDQYIEETIDEIATYLQIKDILGKYYSSNDTKLIEKIAILVTPLFTSTIDLSTLTITINDGQQYMMLSYGNQSAPIESQTLFEHSLWETIPQNTYGSLITLDTDDSILLYHTFNDQTDMVYLVIPIPQQYRIEKGDAIELSLVLSPGIQRTILLEAPLPMKDIVHL